MPLNPCCAPNRPQDRFPCRHPQASIVCRKFTLLSAGALAGVAPLRRGMIIASRARHTHRGHTPPVCHRLETRARRTLVDSLWSPQPVVPVARQVRSEVLDGVTAAVKAERLFEQFECF